MKFSERGVPVLKRKDKLAALTTCLNDGSYEDAAGHLCDLLELCRQNIHPSTRPMFADLPAMVNYYGQPPLTPVEDDDADEPRPSRA